MTEPIDDIQNDDAIATAVRRSLYVVLAIGLVAIVVLVVLNVRKPVAESTESAVTLPTVRSVSATAAPPMPLVPVSPRQTGIEFVHHSGKTGEKLLPETMGSGVAVFDYDNDGNLDVLLVNSTDWPWSVATDQRDEVGSGATTRLYRGRGDFTFEDVSESSGLNPSIYGMGVAVGDYDNDGDRDVYITAVGPNRLYRNDDGVFVDVTEAAGVAGSTDDWSTSTGFFDYDRDGYLDLFVCNYVDWDRDSDASQPFTLDGDTRAYGPPRAFGGSFSRLYRGGPGGVFADVSAEVGIEVRNAATGVPLGKSMGLSIVDVNADGWLDVVVANDTVQNFLFLNRRGDRFDEVAAASGIAFDRASGNARGAMGIDAVRFRSTVATTTAQADAASPLAIGIGNFANESSALYMAKVDAGSSAPPSFIDAAMYTGFGPPTRSSLTFGLFFWDADLDGRLDLFGANGHLEEEIAATQSSQTYAQSPQVFWNAGREATSELTMVSADCVGQAFCRPIVGRAAAYGDLDNDGDQDVIVTVSDGPPAVFRNDQQTGHGWAKFRVLTAAGSDAIGATVIVTAGGQVSSQTVMPTKSYLSQCDPTLTFGLGDGGEITAVQVHYQGRVQRIDPPKSGTTTEIRLDPAT